MNLVFAVPAVLLTIVVGGIVLLIAQGRHARARTPRFPIARGSAKGLVPGVEPPIRLVLLGDSTVAGVCAETHEEGLAGSTGRALAAATGRAVRWIAYGRSGVTANDVGREFVPQIGHRGADVIVLAVGVNDVTRLRSLGRWRRDLKLLIDAIRERAGPIPIVLAGVPPMGRFPALPQPLRSFLGTWAGYLDGVGRRLGRELTGVIHLPTTIDQESDFCQDGYHPGPVGYARWGAVLGTVAGQMLMQAGEGVESER